MKAFFGSNGENEFIIETPDWLVDEVVDEFGPFYDPCPVGPEEDGLETEWLTKCLIEDADCVYVNPPYTRGNISKWVAKCRSEQLKGCLPIVLLIPAYVDTAYFHDYIYEKENVEIRFFKGRIQFKGYSSSRASFASMLVVFRGSGRSLDACHRPFPNRLDESDLLPPNQLRLLDFDPELI